MKARRSKAAEKILSEPNAREQLTRLLMGPGEGTVTTRDGKTYRVRTTRKRESDTEDDQ